MSASPNPFNRAAKPNKPIIQAPTPFTRVTESDESVVGAPATTAQTPANEEVREAKLDNLPHKKLRVSSEPMPQVANKHWPLYFYSWAVTSLLAGLIAGRLLYSLWEHVASHDQKLAEQQTAIQNLTKTQTEVSDQANRVKALNASVDALQALLNAQSKRLADLENGQAGIRDQVNGMSARWQKQMNELRRDRASVAAIPVPKTESSVPAKSSPVPQAQSASDKHNETFSPDLKPTPTSYAQMLPSGLVAWMTPRPGSPKPVPTSVIGYVRGLGMLVHNWEDNKHYFITDSGSWIADQR